MPYNNKTYLFANWKMYLDLGESVELAKNYVAHSNDKIVTVIFPTALAMGVVRNVVENSGISLGAQNTYWVDKGGYTGEISASMFKEAGCAYALVGHAERRHLFHETNHVVRQKLEFVLNQGLTPVICVGETLKERKAMETEEVLESQIRAAFMDLVWPENIELIIAYEPVWAIGTGESCDPEEAERISALISKWTEGLLTGRKPVILYGGSVREENVISYFEKPHISGALVGGASTKAESWNELLRKLV